MSEIELDIDGAIEMQEHFKNLYATPWDFKMLAYLNELKQARHDLVSVKAERDALRHIVDAIDMPPHDPRFPELDKQHLIKICIKQNLELASLREELRKAREQEPVAYLHTIHMEFDQKTERLTNSKEPAFGRPGVNYSEEYAVTCEPLYASPVPAQNWMPIESAPDNEWVLVTGNNMIGDPPEGRFYMRAKKEDDEFISTDGFGEIYNPGYLTHWTHEPKSDENKIIERLPY